MPLKATNGWLFIYIALTTVDHYRQWSISDTLLDLHDPRKIFANVNHILKPETEGETHRVVDQVAFLEGAVVFGENLYV